MGWRWRLSQGSGNAGESAGRVEMVALVESGVLALASAFDVGIACLLFANYFADAGIHDGCERDELILGDLHFVHRVLANGENHASGVKFFQGRLQLRIRVGVFGEEHSDAFAMRDYFKRGGRCAERLLDVLDISQRTEPLFCAIYGDFKNDFVDFGVRLFFRFSRHCCERQRDDRRQGDDVSQRFHLWMVGSSICRQRVVKFSNSTMMAVSVTAKPTTNTPRGRCSRSGSSTLPRSPHLSLVRLVHPESSAKIHQPTTSPAMPKSASQFPCPRAAAAVPGQ